VPAKANCRLQRFLLQAFRDIRVYRLTEPEKCPLHRQVAGVGVRRTRQEKTGLRDAEIIRGTWLASVEREIPRTFAAIAGNLAHLYVPAQRPRALVHRGLPLDQIEDLLPEIVGLSPSLTRSFRKQADVAGRPLNTLPWRTRRSALTAGMLNGIFGDGEARHIATGSRSQARRQV